MNEKITFPRLSAMLADQSGRSKRFSEDFLREFFSLISERLESGDIVKVKGLGTFRLSRVEPRRSVDVTTGQPMEISGHSKVVFVPSKELSDAVNSPFEAFSAIEISDDVDISQLVSKDEIELEEPTEELTSYGNISLTQDEPEEDTKDNTDVSYAKVTVESYSVSEQHDETEDETEANQYMESEDSVVTQMHADSEKSIEPEETSDEIGVTERIEETQNENKSETEDSQGSEEPDVDEELEDYASGKRHWGKIAIISFCAVLMALFATLAVWYIFATDDFNRIFVFNRTASNTVSTPKAGDSASDTDIYSASHVAKAGANEGLISDSASISEEPEVPTAPSDALVYDTISTTRYLTTMARTHYGNFNFWPYIYEENKGILGHPDRIRPGTPVVIPKLSKYGVDPTSKEDLEKAKKMGVEIYARYGKKI